MSICTKSSLCKYEYHERCSAAEADLGDDSIGSGSVDHRNEEYSARGTTLRKAQEVKEREQERPRDLNAFTNATAPTAQTRI